MARAAVYAWLHPDCACTPPTRNGTGLDVLVDTATQWRATRVKCLPSEAMVERNEQHSNSAVAKLTNYWNFMCTSHTNKRPWCLESTYSHRLLCVQSNPANKRNRLQPLNQSLTMARVSARAKAVALIAVFCFALVQTPLAHAATTNPKIKHVVVLMVRRPTPKHLEPLPILTPHAILRVIRSPLHVLGR